MFCACVFVGIGVVHAVTAAAFLSQRHAKNMCLSYNSKSSLSSVTTKAASTDGKFLLPLTLIQHQF